MRISGWRTVVSGEKVTLTMLALLVSAFTMGVLISVPAWSQEESSEEESTNQAEDSTSAKAGEDSGKLKPIPEIQGETSQRQFFEAPGPLAGTETTSYDKNGDGFTDLIVILGDCKAKEGASLVLEDDDGTQGTFIDNENIQIEETENTLKVRSSPPDGPPPPGPIGAYLIRGGDGTLDGGGLTVATSTDITCEDTGGGGGNGGGSGGNGGGGGTPGDKDGDGVADAKDNCPNDVNPDQKDTDGDGFGDACDDTPKGEPLDKKKGPLAGGTAFGKDVLVKKDLLYRLPDGTPVYGIDQVIIKAENCKFTAQGDGLTVTLQDPAGPFRIRDGDNMDFTLKKDGTIVMNGRKTLGDSFPTDLQNNPTRVLIPIPVNPENFKPTKQPNDTFPIISSTGIGGKGCHAVGASATGPDDSNNGASGNGNVSNEVIQDTVPDRPLPDTGGMPLWPVAIIAIAAGAGLAALRMRLPRR